jgi:uncharacterized OB-fold protein
MAYEKFVPEITPLHEPFWAAVKEHRLDLQRCDSCGTFRFIPGEICHRCWSTDATWTTVSGDGEIYTYTVVYRAPTPAYQEDAPYAIVHVQLPEGPRMTGTLVDCAPDAIEVGMPVRVVFDDVTPELTLYRFAPVR